MERKVARELGISVKDRREIESSNRAIDNVLSFMRAPAGDPQTNSLTEIPPPAEREIGRIYKTNAGFVIWRGNGWEPVVGER